MAKWRLEAIIPNNGFVCSIIKVLFKVIYLGLGLGAGCSWVPNYTFGAGAGGWVLLGSTGLVLSGPAQDPARLVYGSAALVASLRGQQNHFATLPKIRIRDHPSSNSSDMSVRDFASPRPAKISGSPPRKPGTPRALFKDILGGAARF